MEPKRGKTKRSESYLLLFVLMIGVVILWFLSYFVLETLGEDAPTRGQIGDQFGAVNALFSGLAFAGIIYTIFLQRTELGLQREELAATREELKRTAKAQEETREELGKQVATQLRAARIAGLSTLIEHMSHRVAVSERRSEGEQARQFRENRDQFLEDLKKEIHESR